MQLQLHKAQADIFVPDGLTVDAALRRTTHLGIGAHPDDLEFGALHGILECFGQQNKWFTGVTCTDGAGSARVGVYANYSDAEMTKVRFFEQRTAAMIGRYAAIVQLGYTSREVKDSRDRRLEEDLLSILQVTRPRIVYIHNPADKHATHVAVGAAALKALRRLPTEMLPEKVYGFESWRGLDWLPDDRKAVLNVGGRDNLLAALMGVYDSQIAGGKCYDSATFGRLRANATMFESHSVDKLELASYALDLTPLVKDRSADVVAYVVGFIDEFRAAVAQELGKFFRD